MVQAIPLKHNAPNYGYIIDVQGTRIVIATDCVDFPYKIPHVNAWMIEITKFVIIFGEQKILSFSKLGLNILFFFTIRISFTRY